MNLGHLDYVCQKVCNLLVPFFGTIEDVMARPILLNFRQNEIIFDQNAQVC